MRAASGCSAEIKPPTPPAAGVSPGAVVAGGVVPGGTVGAAPGASPAAGVSAATGNSPPAAGWLALTLDRVWQPPLTQISPAPQSAPLEQGAAPPTGPIGLPPSKARTPRGASASTASAGIDPSNRRRLVAGEDADTESRLVNPSNLRGSICPSLPRSPAAALRSGRAGAVRGACSFGAARSPPRPPVQAAAATRKLGQRSQ